MGKESNSSEVEQLPARRQTHKRDPITFRRIAMWCLAPLQPARSPTQESRPSIRRPPDLPKTSRYRARRRARRLRRRRRLLFIKWAKRAIYTLVIVTSTLVVLFWAKFAIIYNVPGYLQTGRLQDAGAYLVFKSWWFGPPSFNLASYHDVDPQDPEASLVIQLERYQDIVTNPDEIIYVWTKGR